jgi:hypothetical protein
MGCRVLRRVLAVTVPGEERHAVVVPIACGLGVAVEKTVMDRG